MRNLFITSILAFVAIFASTISLQAQNWDDEETNAEESVMEAEIAVTIFAKANFEGTSFEINELNSFDSQTLAEEFEGRMISSIQVSEGVVVRLYLVDNFEGESFEVTSDMKILPAEWVGKVRSLEVVLAEQGGSDGEEGW